MVSLEAYSFPEVERSVCYQQVFEHQRMGSSAENILHATDRFGGGFSVDQPVGGLRKTRSFTLPARSKDAVMDCSLFLPLESEAIEYERDSLTKDNVRYYIQGDEEEGEFKNPDGYKSAPFKTTFRHNKFDIPNIYVQTPDELCSNSHSTQQTLTAAKQESEQAARDNFRNVDYINTLMDPTSPHCNQEGKTNNDRANRRQEAICSFNRKRSISWSETGSEELRSPAIRISSSWCASLNSARQTDLCSTDL